MAHTPTTLPVIDVARTGHRIHWLRQNTGLSVRELQNILGFATPNAIYKWQTGAALPTLDNLLALSKIFQVTMDDIIVTTEVDEQKNEINMKKSA